MQYSSLILVILNLGLFELYFSRYDPSNWSFQNHESLGPLGINSSSAITAESKAAELSGVGEGENFATWTDVY